MIKPGIRFKQFVEHFLPECETRVITRDKHDEYAQVLGAVLTLDGGDELRFDRLAQFHKQLLKNHELAEVTLCPASVRDPDCPEDDEGCSPECSMPYLVIRIDLFGRRK